MPRKFDRNEQHLLRHSREDFSDWGALGRRCFNVAFEKILSNAIETQEDPNNLSDDDLYQVMREAFMAVMKYLQGYVNGGYMSEPEGGPDPLEVMDLIANNQEALSVPSLDAFISEILSSAIEQTGKVLDGNPEALLHHLQQTISQYQMGPGYSKEVAEVHEEPTGPVFDDKPVGQDAPQQEMNLLPRELPEEMTDQIPGWGHPPICDCPDCIDDVDPDDPRLPGFQRLNKTAGDDVRAVYIKFQPQDHHQQVRLEDGAAGGDGMEDSCPWIYWPEDNAVLFGPPNSFHYEMLMSDKELRDKLLGGDNDQALPVWQKFLQSGELLSGRVTWPPNSHATQPRSDQEVFFYGSPSPEEVDLVNRALETDQPAEDDDFKFN